MLTHPIHPFFGQRLPVVRFCKTGPGSPAVVVRLPSTRTLVVALAWTDRRPRAEPPEVDGRSVRLDPRALHELVALIADLNARSSSHKSK